LQPFIVGVPDKTSVHHENGFDVHQELEHSVREPNQVSDINSPAGDVRDLVIWDGTVDNSLIAHIEEIEAQLKDEIPQEDVVDDSESNDDSNEFSEEDDDPDYQFGSEEDEDDDVWTETVLDENVALNNDDFTDPPLSKVHNYTYLLREMDDFVNPPLLVDNPLLSPVQVKRRKVSLKELSSNQKKEKAAALKRGITLCEIYGFEDIEPMFIESDSPDFRGHNIDLSKEDNVMFKGTVFETKDEFKVALSIYAINQIFQFSL